MTINKLVLLLLICICFTSPSYAQPTSLWNKIEQQTWSRAGNELRATAKSANYLEVDQTKLKKLFENKKQIIRLDIPLPDGQIAEFSLKPSTVMPAALAAKFPNIMTFRGEQTNNPNNYGGFSISHKGLSGMFKHNGEWVFLSPQIRAVTNRYISYYWDDAVTTEGTFIAQHKSDQIQLASAAEQYSLSSKASAPSPTGSSIRTYRLAIAASGEYTAAQGGSIDDAMAEIVRLVNRVNQILLVDLALQFQLVDNNDQIIYLNAETDPYTNSDSEADLEANQATLDQVVKTANYDIGHLLNTNGGGLAYVGAVCNSQIKAQGYTGDSPPSGERFYIDLVIHELGHQLGANHTFNASNSGSCTADQRSASSAFEPGSGSTIMSYAGICDNDQNLQRTSDAFFHAGSIEQIRSYVDSGSGRNCGSDKSQDNVAPDILVAADTYSIPANTPFILTATASDNDGDNLNFSWEQINPGGTNGGTASGAEMGQDTGSNPLFKFRPPTSQPIRYFPQLSDVLVNKISKGEVYPTTDRQLDFRLTARDNKGGVNTTDVSIDVLSNNTGFMVSQPTADTIWPSASQQTVIWDVSNSNQSPINCTSVDVLLDIDGNNTFDGALLSATKNDGETQVVVPSSITSKARIMLKCSNNIFYAVNPGSFSITDEAEPIAPLIIGQQTITIEEDQLYSISFDDLIVEDPDNLYPQGFSLNVQGGNDYSFNNQSVTPNENFNGDILVSISVNDGSADSNLFALLIHVNPVNDLPLAANDAATVLLNSSATLIDVLNNDQDADGDELSVLSADYSGAGIVTIEDNQISYTPANGFTGSETISYTIDDSQGGNGSASLTVTVNAPPPTPVNNSASSGGGSISWMLAYLTVLLAGRKAIITIRPRNV